jgi:hypothetical protein
MTPTPATRAGTGGAPDRHPRFLPRRQRAVGRDRAAQSVVLEQITVIDFNPLVFRT